MASSYTDKTYIDRVSYMLEHFIWTSDTVANFRCPLCGDSSKNSRKRRGFLIESKEGDGFVFYCHNCGESHSLRNFLKLLDKNLYKEYCLDSYRNSDDRFKPVHSTKKKKRKVQVSFRKSKEDLEDCTRCDLLPKDHSCYRFLEGRMIPKEMWSKLFYSSDFKVTAGLFDSDGPEKYENMLSEGRLVIPFYDEVGKINTIQGRSLSPQASLRYITVKKNKDSCKIYGLDRLDRSKPVLVVEGPIDSMFLPNCVASADADLTTVEFGDIFIWDKSKDDINILKRMENAISENKQIVIWHRCPFQGKDINEFITSGSTQYEVMDYITKNVYSGLKAKLMLGRWRSEY